ncbi:MAG TPA: sulfotransferase [Actinomycetota bacterium]
MSHERGPIFIGGLSHSGKTPVRTVLGAHPDLSMTRRTYLWDRHYRAFGDLADPRNLERCLSALLADPGVARLRPDPDRLRRELLEEPVTYARLFGLLHRHHAEREGKRRWGEQLGFVERFADPIFAGFPSARMIHMIRDPRSDTGEGARGRFGAVGWRTARWLTSAELAERNLRRYAGRYRVVRYESLVAAPDETIRDLCAFLGEDYVPSMQRVLATIAFGTERPLDATPDRGRGTGSAPALAFVDRYAGRDLRAFDYAPVTEAWLSTRDRLSFALLERPLNRASMVAWRLLEGRSMTKQVRS